ncbi:hypothetical protein A2U01_0103170, partial [Trifolium medium]|nr:hypothetical protein [Trifolium medium]
MQAKSVVLDEAPKVR